MKTGCMAVSNSVIPWTVTHQPPLPIEFSRPEYWSGLPFPSSGDLPNPGVEPGSPALQADSLPTELLGKPNLRVQQSDSEPLGNLTLEASGIRLKNFHRTGETDSWMAQTKPAQNLHLCAPAHQEPGERSNPDKRLSHT